jgi:hypothetical protein
MQISSAGDNVQPTPDGIAPLPGADLVFTYVGTIANGDGGVRWDGAGHRSVFMSFGVEGIMDPVERDEVVARVLQWFGAQTGVADPQAAAPLVRLAQNVPNPFRPTTSISYELAGDGRVSLRIFDVSGRVVRTLVDRHQSGSLHTIEWNGTDDRGHSVPSGVYFYLLEAPGVSETRRMVLSR